MKFRLQDPGEGIHEAEIIEVLVSAGDRVEEGQSVLVVETDKASVQIPAPTSDVVREINVKAGEIVHVGDVLMTFGEGGEGDDGDAAGAAERHGRHERRRRDQEDQQQPGAEESLEEAEEAPEEAGEARAGAEDRSTDRKAGRPVPAAPATRRIARERGVDLREVAGRGRDGRVTRADVEAAASSEADRRPRDSGRRETASSLPDFEQFGAIERVPLRSVRRATARRMAQSWSRIPHVVHVDYADITELDAFRRRHTGQIEKEGGKLTLTVFAMKAAVAVLRRHPRFNASLDEERDEIVQKGYYNIGVALDSERGLLVPVIRDVDRKSLTELSVELKTLSDRARKGEARRADMTGGTFTITNVGPLGGRAFSPIINWPEVAILGLARARLDPVVRGDLEAFEIVPRLRVPICVGFDHRVVDGADAARFTGSLIATLADSEEFMLMM